MTAAAAIPRPALDTGAAAVTIAAGFFGVASDYAQLRHRFAAGDALSVADTLKALRALGLKARLVSSGWKRLEGTPLPAIVVGKDGNFAVLGKIAEGKALVMDPANDDGPRVVERGAFEDAWSGRLILVAKRAAPTLSEVAFGLGWFVKAMGRHKAIFAEVLLASFFIQVFALLSPLFFQVVVDKVLVHRGLTTLDVLMVGFVALALFDVLLGGLRSYLMAHTTSRVDVTLGARLFEHLVALPMAWFQARPAGQCVARVRELENIRNFLTGSALTLVLDLFFTVVFLAVMWWYSPTLTLIVLGALPLFAVVSLVVTPVLRTRLEEQFQRRAVNQSFLVETVSGIETAKAMAVEPQLQRRWEEGLAAYVSSSFKARTTGLIGGQAIQLVNKLMMAMILYVGAKLAVAGEITVGMLVAFNMLAGQVSQPVLRLAQLWQDFQQARISVARLGDILNTATEGQGGPGRAALPAIAGRIAFEGVGFRYRPDAPKVLDGIDLTIEAGTSLGVVGTSGSGKSTLTKLIQRLHLPDGGRVAIDGIDVAQADPAWLRRQVGVVLQESVLFSGTVRENIALADPAAPMARVIEAARLAGAHDFIAGLPQGYDTAIGERGASLSGGQRQRVAIARALITNPRILIFDEATSALDYESEAAIQANMQDICQGRTVIVIAHRLSAVRGCDRIAVLERGKVVEEGRHDALLVRNGRYAALWRMQAH